MPRIKYPEIGVCGLSCRLCPNFRTNAPSRCTGCKSEIRMAVGCPFITCAVKKKRIEFCWECEESSACLKWKKHREYGKSYDTFKCYSKLEENIHFIFLDGVKEFEKIQKVREKILIEMLRNFNEGRSKSYYCIAATVLPVEELQAALLKAKKQTEGLDIKPKSQHLHTILNEIAAHLGYSLRLRKPAS